MNEFATANFVARRQMIEEALADVLRRVGEIDNDHDMGRCLVIAVARNGCTEFERHSLWDLATALEAKLS